jgi:hypothetical protein
MLAFVFIIFMSAAAAILQTAVCPALLPGVLRPDICLLLGISMMAFAPRNMGLIAIFTQGVMADLFSSGRFGLLTLCYLLTAGLLLWAAWRELSDGDVLAAWIGSVLATLLAHGLYVFIGRKCGLILPVGQSFTTVLSLTLGALVWGLPVVYCCGRMMHILGVSSPEIREKWTMQARLSAARRGKSLRA